ncbi:hypothetical protein PROFUN_13174 [Planoprotostelium fungivorum]|uniref:Uncharacterized protein n=1 Tax=Planoprotostelium fungivorum TaxID=1890364 RepID=A0A2P6N551_9EUKA|nr:hypothetical protein PROFUN_13174 [Planoprotostelium fungivorum]
MKTVLPLLQTPTQVPMLAHKRSLRSDRRRQSSHPLCGLLVCHCYGKGFAPLTPDFPHPRLPGYPFDII